MIDHPRIKVIRSISINELPSETWDYTGIGSDFEVEDCDWFYCEIDPKIFTESKCLQHEGSSYFWKSKKTPELWKDWWSKELQVPENAPDLRDIQSLETNWIHEINESKEYDALTLTLWGKDISIEDGYHRAAVSVIHNLSKVYAFVGVPRR